MQSIAARFIRGFVYHGVNIWANVLKFSFFQLLECQCIVPNGWAPHLPPTLLTHLGPPPQDQTLFPPHPPPTEPPHHPRHLVRLTSIPTIPPQFPMRHLHRLRLQRSPKTMANTLRVIICQTTMSSIWWKTSLNSSHNKSQQLTSSLMIMLFIPNQQPICTTIRLSLRLIWPRFQQPMHFRPRVTTDQSLVTISAVLELISMEEEEKAKIDPMLVSKKSNFDFIFI